MLLPTLLLTCNNRVDQTAILAEISYCGTRWHCCQQQYHQNGEKLQWQYHYQHPEGRRQLTCFILWSMWTYNTSPKTSTTPAKHSPATSYVTYTQETSFTCGEQPFVGQHHSSIPCDTINKTRGFGLCSGFSYNQKDKNYVRRIWQQNRLRQMNFQLSEAGSGRATVYFLPWCHHHRSEEITDIIYNAVSKSDHNLIIPVTRWDSDVVMIPDSTRI